MIEFEKGYRILGVDPGSRVAGFSIIQAKKKDAMLPQDFQVLELGVIRVNTGLSLPQRLGDLHEALFKIISQTHPRLCVLEKAFVGQNANSALKLGEARGALASAAHRKGLPVHELTPAEVKKTIAGSGTANKVEVKASLQRLIGLENTSLPYDATDALAIALSFAIGANHLSSKKSRGCHRIADVAIKKLGL